MKSNYRRLGDFIEEINIRNRDLEVDLLLGVSIRKVLMPSIANTIGSDMSKYKIISKNQFAYGPITSRNGDKISIALLQDYEKALLSQAYKVFQIIDSTQLLPEYLMMWFRRPEFDRYARYMSHGSTREAFDWQELCEVELPVPSLEKQQEIVDDYNTVQDRIRINEQLNTALEETAQALYKHWFVDFNFPITEESCPELVSGSPHLLGQPYKSSGGAMVYNEELDMEIPVGWEVRSLEQEFEFRNGKKKPKNSGSIPIYGGNGILGFTNKFNSSNSIIIGRVGAYCGSLFLEQQNFWTSDNAINAIHNSNCNYYAFHLLKSLNINEKSEGTGQPLITQKILSSIRFLQPTLIVVKSFESLAGNLLHEIERLRIMNKNLVDTSSLLLSKMATAVDGKELKQPVI